jgi:cellulose synthase/poly-beta-1,6-N-acetylglucosamine synthase-like glycosyltransferase
MMQLSKSDAEAPELYLPRPPGRREKYEYFGKPRRWVFAWLLIAAVGILYGYVRVAEHAWVVTPLMWLLLMVMVPPVVVNFWLRAGRPRLTLAEHQATVAAYREQGETIDIYLPSCGEPLAILNNTYHYAAQMKWRGVKTVYVLDDSAREQVRELAETYGFRYIVRPNPGEMKKAGNLTHALTVSDGDFIVVIDADFAVRSDFLHETMPYFADPKVGIVQTAQCFDVTNPTLSYIQRYAGTLQEIFFRFIQPARDRYKAAICAGTNLVYRRAAVDAAGGFAQVPIGEDVHSGVKLWWAGYETRYLQLCLCKGVAPTDFASLANQQARWCRSSMLLMLDPHFQKAPFTWQQRAAFWAAFLYYMSSAALVITGPFPTIAMIWFFPEKVFPHNYLPIIPAMAAGLFAFPFLSRGWRPTIYRLCVINSCCHLYAVWFAVRGVVAEWIPTGASPDSGVVPVMVSRMLRTWILLVLVVIWSGLALRVHEYGWRQYWATEVLAGVQIYMLVPLLTRSKGVWRKAQAAVQQATSSWETVEPGPQAA